MHEDEGIHLAVSCNYRGFHQAALPYPTPTAWPWNSLVLIVAGIEAPLMDDSLFGFSPHMGLSERMAHH